MKNIIPLVLSMLLASCGDSPAQTPVGEGEYRIAVASVYDGDTFNVRFEGLPPELNPVKIRVRGVDSPERGSPKCDAERRGAERARAFTEQHVGQEVVISNLEWDKYGGRVDADVLTLPHRQSLATLLIESSNARPYEGGRRQGWC